MAGSLAMEASGRMQRASREVWQKRVERWKDSGLTADEFAAEIGVNAGTLKFWQYRLNKESRAAGSPVRSSRRRGAANGAPKKRDGVPHFIEVVPTVESTLGTAIEIAIGDAVVSVRGDFQDETLRRVLDAVRASR